MYCVTKRNLTKKTKRSPEERHTQTHGSLIEKRFDNHRCLSRSEESKCMWTHYKDGIMFLQNSHVAPSLPCVHIHLLSSDQERHLFVKTFQLSFRMSLCLSSRDLFIFSVRYSSLFSYYLCSQMNLVSYWFVPGMNFVLQLQAADPGRRRQPDTCFKVQTAEQKSN